MVYKINYGWFNIGEAEMWIDPEFHYQNKRPYYHIQCHITTASWFKIFSTLEICMESLVQVENLTPLRSDRDLTGRNRIDIRHDYFTYGKQIKVDAYIEDIDTWRHHIFSKNTVSIRDALSTYLFLRSRNRNEMLKPVTVRTFFTNDLYEFNMIPKGKTTYKYKGKHIAARRFDLIFPESEFFPNGKKGRVILTDDHRRLPLKIEIDMSFGSFGFDLIKEEYE